MEDKIKNLHDEIKALTKSLESVQIDKQATPGAAEQYAQKLQQLVTMLQYQAKKDAAIFQTAQATVEQKTLLGKQIESLQQQNQLLQQLYQQAQKEAEERKEEAEESKKQARHNKIFGWVSFAVGTAIGLAGVLVGIFV